jgi:hypothetical protein
MFQNALAELQLSETYAIMADTGARLCALAQCPTGIAECPPARYFQDTAAEIQNLVKDTHLSIEEAMLLLESFEREANKKADISTNEALTGRLLNCFFYHGVGPSATFHCHVPYVLETWVAILTEVCLIFLSLPVSYGFLRLVHDHFPNSFQFITVFLG